MKYILASSLIAAVCASCATSKPIPPRSAEATFSACHTAVETDGVKGIVRHVPGPPSRELWDVDGDGNLDYELRSFTDEQGRVVKTERAAPDQTVIERITREWDGERLFAETGDVFDAKGHARADGTPDWRRELLYEGDRLVEERIDQRDGNMLPGIDGTPEFRIVWTWENGVRTGGTRFRGERAVATVANTWEGANLVESRTDFGDDGTLDLVERRTYDAQGRLTGLTSEGPDGRKQLTYGYCD